MAYRNRKKSKNGNGRDSMDDEVDIPSSNATEKGGTARPQGVNIPLSPADGPWIRNTNPARPVVVSRNGGSIDAGLRTGGEVPISFIDPDQGTNTIVGRGFSGRGPLRCMDWGEGCWNNPSIGLASGTKWWGENTNVTTSAQGRSFPGRQIYKDLRNVIRTPNDADEETIVVEITRILDVLTRMWSIYYSFLGFNALEKSGISGIRSYLTQVHGTPPWMIGEAQKILAKYPIPPAVKQVCHEHFKPLKWDKNERYIHAYTPQVLSASAQAPLLAISQIQAGEPTSLLDAMQQCEKAIAYAGGLNGDSYDVPGRYWGTTNPLDTLNKLEIIYGLPAVEREYECVVDNAKWFRDITMMPKWTMKMYPLGGTTPIDPNQAVFAPCYENNEPSGGRMQIWTNTETVPNACYREFGFPVWTFDSTFKPDAQGLVDFGGAVWAPGVELTLWGTFGGVSNVNKTIRPVLGLYNFEIGTTTFEPCWTKWDYWTSPEMMIKSKAITFDSAVTDPAIRAAVGQMVIQDVLPYTSDDGEFKKYYGPDKTVNRARSQDVWEWSVRK